MPRAPVMESFRDRFRSLDAHRGEQSISQIKTALKVLPRTASYGCKMARKGARELLRNIVNAPLYRLAGSGMLALWPVGKSAFQLFYEPLRRMPFLKPLRRNESTHSTLYAPPIRARLRKLHAPPFLQKNFFSIYIVRRCVERVENTYESYTPQGFFNSTHTKKNAKFCVEFQILGLLRRLTVA